MKRYEKKASSLNLLIFNVFLLFFSKSFAHCQIPCGIYDDHMRIHLIEEHIQTIEKSMNELAKLSKDKVQDQHQFVRWVVSKEEHAGHIQKIVSEYFLTQRIKETMPSYIDQLKTLHNLLVLSMKAKQSVDLKTVSDLRKTLKSFEDIYEKALKEIK